jgi:TRAP-type C4-dicarboxylate transport system substrate-binding protein
MKTSFFRHASMGVALLAAGALIAACGSSGGDSNPTDTGSGSVEPSPDQTTQTSEPDQVFDLQFTAFTGENNPTSQAIIWWVEQVEAASNGAINIEMFWQQSLLSGADTVAGLKDGRADLALVGGAFYPDLALSNVVAVPFVTNNGDAQMRAFYDLYQSSPAFIEEYESRGMHVLVFPMNTPNIIGSTEPINSLTDLEGLNIRASGYISQALAAAGANPIALPSPEIYESMQRGVIDAYSGFTFDYIVDFKLQEVAPITTNSGLGNYVISPFVISTRIWNELPDNLKSIMTDASLGFMDKVVELTSAADVSTCDTILDSGGAVAVMPENQVEEWRGIVGNSISDEWAGTVPAGVDAQAFWDEYLGYLAVEEAETPYVPGVIACATRS